MAIAVNWSTKVISVPQADLTFVSGSLYELDVNAFRLTLKNLEADEAGMPFLRTHNHNAPVTVGGATLARVVEIINGYTITFGDGQYAVRLVGANNNIPDVVNVNQVSVRSNNSAGLVEATAATAAAAAVLASIIDGTATLALVLKRANAYVRGTATILPLDASADDINYKDEAGAALFTNRVNKVTKTRSSA